MVTYRMPEPTPAGARALADRTGERVLLVLGTMQDPTNPHATVPVRELAVGEAAIARKQADLTYLSRNPLPGGPIVARIYAPAR